MTIQFLSRNTATRRSTAGKPLLQYVFEMYGPPEDVRTRRVPHGRKGAEQDATNIRGYFRRSVKQLEAEIANG